jgi:FlaA1/EpsC-like NDP-sugar epimerase
MTQLGGRRILITGGTGSVGRALAEKILSNEYGEPRQVVIFSRDESKQADMHRELGMHQNLYFQIGDIRVFSDVVKAVSDVDVVFHCAAMKHVPACEDAPVDAVMTNVLGANNIVAAIKMHRFPVECVVVCSTDKACNPVSIMGMTKAIQEKIFLNAAAGSETRYVICRFGNIPGSRGSVIPLFKQQIAAGQSLTITDPDMTRFMLFLPRAVEIMLKAHYNGKRGDIFVPIMPASTIWLLAQVMSNPTTDAKIIGARPGERKHEVIISAEESLRALAYSDYAVIKPVIQDPAMIAREYSSNDTLITDQRELELMLRSEGIL